VPKIVRTVLLLYSLIFLTLQPLVITIVNAEIVRHSKEVERLLTDRIVCTDIVSRWLEDIGLTNISRELKMLAEELRFKDLANLSSLLLFEVYTNASMALTIGGIELRALKRLAGYGDVITLRDVIRLIDVVRRQLLRDATPIPSCSSTLSKVITDITYGLHGHRCSYNFSDVLTIAFLWVSFLNDRTMNKDGVERGFEDVLVNLFVGNVSRGSLYGTLKLLTAYRSLVLGISLYEILDAIQRTASTHNQHTSDIGTVKRSIVSSVLEVVRFFQELRSINTHISGRDVLLALSLIESVNEMFSDFSDVGTLARVGRELVKLYLRHGGTSPISSLTPITLGCSRDLEYDIEKALIMLRIRGRSLPTMVEKSWYNTHSTSTEYVKGLESVSYQHENETHLKVLRHQKYGYGYTTSLGLDLNLVDVVADPQILNLLNEVNSIDLINHNEIDEDREVEFSSVTSVKKEHKLMPVYAYVQILVPIVVVLSITLSILRTAVFRTQSPQMFKPTSFAITVPRRGDPLFTEFWRTITKIATRYGIAILLSDTHREAVRKLMTVLDEVDRYRLSWISRLYELARFSRTKVTQSDRKRALQLLQHLSRKHCGEDGR